MLLGYVLKGKRQKERKRDIAKTKSKLKIVTQKFVLWLNQYQMYGLVFMLNERANENLIRGTNGGSVQEKTRVEIINRGQTNIKSRFNFTLDHFQMKTMEKKTISFEF